jgi:hypothetical protein
MVNSITKEIKVQFEELFTDDKHKR